MQWRRSTEVPPILRRALHLLARPLWVFLAVLFLVEAWFWERLRPLFTRLLSRIPWQNIRAALARGAAHIPPWLALPLFLIPFLGVEPLKAVALILIAEGRFGDGVLLFAAAQIFALGTSAFMFDLLRPQLLSFAWFRRAFEWVMNAHHWALRQVAPARRRIMLAVARFRRRRNSPIGQRIASIRRWARRPFRAAT